MARSKNTRKAKRPKATGGGDASRPLRVGITGASGFVGRAVIAEAGAAGLEVVAFSRNGKLSLPGTIETRGFGDPELADYRGIDAVIHLAGEPVLGLWTAGKKRRIYDSRVEGTRSLVKGLEKMPSAERPRTLVAASGIGFYGDSGDAVVDEDSDVGFGFLADVVRDWEAAVGEASEIGLRTVMFRIGLVLGEGGGALPVLRRVFRGFLGGRLGDGRQWMSWIHVTDLARALVHGVRNEALSGPVNAVAPYPVTNAEFTRALAGQLERPAFLSTPGFALKMAPGGMQEMFLFSQRVDPSILRLRGFEWRYPRLEPALAAALGSGQPATGD